MHISALQVGNIYVTDLLGVVCAFYILLKLKQIVLDKNAQ